MDPNLLYWKSHGQSFLSRLQVWVNLLDPTSLLASNAELLKAHNLLGGGEQHHEKGEHAPTLSLSSIHADSGAVLPLVFRPPAFLPAAAPLVIAGFFPHRRVRSALFWQFLLNSYTAGFNLANGNSSLEEQDKNMSLKRLLLVTGAVSYAACAGALPQMCMNRLGVISAPFQTFFRTVLPIPLSAALAFFNVMIVRSEEGQAGIRVFDSEGNPAGLSKAAGEKAVRETAVSRATLFGTTVAAYNLLPLVLRRGKLFKRNSLLIASVCHISVLFMLGLMIPVSFSLYPQLGTIQKEDVEKELQAAGNHEQLFYHRGL